MTRDEVRTQQLLQAVERGDPGACEELLPMLYEELRGIAHGMMRRQPLDHTLQTTALVHEAYLRLAPGHGGVAQSPHFLALAATAMRCVLLDYARAARAVKRDQHGAHGFGLEDLVAKHGEEHSLLDIAAAIEELAGADPELARIAELRVFGGLEHEDIAELLGCSVRTSERRWRLARVLLERRLDHG
jgi:RNA polymerase sigma factor (TIGR02999 family)